jgi:CheY-like chemotaxis protein
LQLGEAVASVLVVDDDEPIRNLLARVLERDGHAVTSARHGDDAIGALAQRAFDLLVLDLMMPVADGSGVLAFMREQQRWTPTIIVTAMHRKQIASMNIEGVVSILEKPFDIAALQARVADALPRSPD